MIRETLLFLVRHGESEANIDPSVYSQKNNSEIDLSPLGITQSKNAAVQIETFLQNASLGSAESAPLTVDLCISPTLRTRRTADPILAKLEQANFSLRTSIELLCVEQYWGDAEGSPSFKTYIDNLDDENRIREQNVFRTTDSYRYAPPRGESLLDVYIRCGLVLEKYQWFRHARVAIIVAHKMFLIAFENYLEKNIPSYEQTWPNAQIHVHKLKHDNHKSEFVGKC
jgi:broad specificity phosphatase PhoE